MNGLSRRELLRLLGGGAAAYVVLNALGCSGDQAGTPALQAGASLAAEAPAAAELKAAQPAPPARQPQLAVARGADPAEITRRAVTAVGGMERYVKPGQTVIVKPNICHVPQGIEYATTTHPQVVGALVSLALAAGARKVQVMDAPFSGRPDEAYARSGIAEAVAAAGGEMAVMTPVGFVNTAIPLGRSLNKWSVYQPALEADVIIDVPVAKHHSIARLTLGMKNLMGLIDPVGRGRFHGNLHQNIADLTTLFRPALTVVDAVRVLLAHGPTGGNLDDVRWENTVIASPDIVAADAYATTLFGRQPADIGYIAAAAEMGLGRADLDALSIEELGL